MDKQILEVLKEIRDIQKENQGIAKQSVERQKQSNKRVFILFAIFLIVMILLPILFK